MTPEELLLKLNEQPEIDPDSHDGSYELMREIIKSYSTINDYSVIDYKDLNAVYAMALGTWKLNVERKKEYVNNGHLPSGEKTRMAQVIDHVWDNACYSRYENRENNKSSIGMFGTGFYSFERNADDSSSQRFIKLMVDISNMTDDDQMYDCAARVFNKDFKGMQAAAASVMLHCLKPFTFPILNTNFGDGTIFEALGIKLEKEGRLITYIDNCRRIKAFRDAKVTVKNYRVFDRLPRFIEGSNAPQYLPALDEYDPGISCDKYVELFQQVVDKSLLDTVYYIYLLGGEATCKYLSKNYGNAPQHYNSNATHLAQIIQKATNCPINPRDDFASGRYWAILFHGRYANKDEQGVFSWKLRQPLYDAIATLDSEGFFEYLNVKEEPARISISKNTILYGPPGTGKTYNTVIYAVAIVEKKQIEEIKAEAAADYKAVKGRYDEYVADERIAFTTFHQSYGYEEFIEGIKPIMNSGDKENKELQYSIEPGVFKAFCEKAAGNADNYVFIIDEINRGNISKIFGELITLIEETKRIGAKEETTAKLPYSHEAFGVPDNVYIIGTMNTADRSIAIMDTALRRRFSFVEMLPDSDVLRSIGADVVRKDGVELNVADMLDNINDRIVYLYDREHTIGHAFFTPLKDDSSISTLAGIFEKSIIPLLQEYFYEDYAKIQLVLGDDGKTGENQKYQFIRDTDMTPDAVFETLPDMESVKKYEIQYSAFDKIESYKMISKKL